MGIAVFTEIGEPVVVDDLAVGVLVVAATGEFVVDFVVGALVVDSTWLQIAVALAIAIVDNCWHAALDPVLHTGTFGTCM